MAIDMIRYTRNRYGCMTKAFGHFESRFMRIPEHDEPGGPSSPDAGRPIPRGETDRSFSSFVGPGDIPDDFEFRRVYMFKNRS
jgi:hypothetical protein